MILVVFHTAGINEKKNIIIMKKKFWYRTWATAQVSLRLGWALGAGRAGAGRTGAGAVGAGAAGAGARRQLGRREHGRAQQVRGHGMDAQGRAACAGRGARGGRLGGLCTPGVRNWARLGVLLHLAQFLAWFDSVFFPSHQMNTVHCEKIFFFEKKKNI